MLAGVGAGGAAALVTQPLDCAKTRIQVGQAPRSAGLLQVLARVYAREGSGAPHCGGGGKSRRLNIVVASTSDGRYGLVCSASFEGGAAPAGPGSALRSWWPHGSGSGAGPESSGPRLGHGGGGDVGAG